jgi:uncharacterized cupin superfamily protein
MPTVKDIIIRKPTPEEEAACRNWPVWTSPVSRFEWEYTQLEKCLILEGRVTVTDNPETGQSVSFGPGDYVIFPNGLQCVWTVTAPVRKHYDFE